MAKNNKTKDSSNKSEFIELSTNDGDRFKTPTKEELKAIPADIKKLVEDAYKRLSNKK